MNTGGRTARKIAALALVSGLGLMAFILESLLPSMAVPGAKPGIANIFSLAALIMYSPAEAFLVVAVRTVLGAAVTGNFSALMYSFTGGAAAVAVSSLLMYCVHPRVSLTAVSIASAVAHNLVQNAVFALLAGTVQAFWYMPYLILLGVISGAAVGGLTLLLFRGIPENVFAKLINERTPGKPGGNERL